MSYAGGNHTAKPLGQSTDIVTSAPAPAPQPQSEQQGDQK